MAKKIKPLVDDRVVSAPVDLSHITEQLRPLAVPIDDLIPDPANARKHGDENLTAICASLRVYGQRKPIVVNRRNSVVEAGNGTLAAARHLKWSHIAAVYVDDDPSTAAGFGISDNRTSELAEWNDDALEALLRTIDTGDEDLQAMLSALAEQEEIIPTDEESQPIGDPDDVPEVATGEPVTKPGDVWLMGEHRVCCGDSTNADDVARLMSGNKAKICFTSPPYGQQRDYTAEGKAKCADWDGLMCGVFANLPMDDDGQVLVNLGLIHRDGEWIPYWDSWIEWMRSQGWRRFGWYVWDQGSGLPGDWNGRFAPSYEFVFHFNRDAVKPLHCVPKKDENIRDRTGESVMRMGGQTTSCTSGKAHLNTHKIPDSVIRVQRQCGRIESGDYHPAVYPVALPSLAMECWPGLIYEPFCGSGSTVIAAEKLNRRCFGMEISPQYVDVIVTRWMKFTGKTAVLESTGEPFPTTEPSS